MSLKGRVALVTGGGRGIGKGIALALAEAGADVGIVYRRDEDAAKETVKELSAFKVRAAMFNADVSDLEAVKKAVDDAIKTLGKVDILVNNAGIASRGRSIFDTDPSEVRRLIDTHLFGSLYFTQAVLPNMRQQRRGDIIYISSVAVEGHGANGGPYNMAKAAIEALAQTLAKEERPNNIRVNIVRPGLVETEMGRRLARATRGVEDIKELNATSPFGRVGQPSDIGNLVAFLCSQKGEYITAAAIKVSGG